MATRFCFDLQVVRQSRRLQKRLADYAHNLVTAVEKNLASERRAARETQLDAIAKVASGAPRSPTSYASARAAPVCKAAGSNEEDKATDMRVDASDGLPTAAVWVGDDRSQSSWTHAHAIVSVVLLGRHAAIL